MKENDKLGYILGQAAITIGFCCISSIIIATTIKVIQWIIF